ncbi:hypothetical protein [Cognatiyoonia sp. IB215182]|uniref:hypothetical protein n=1 Tax=Cognatiyoonia sp. IB215182 TaxID=3097353 RepID=UPI002A1814AD|nr:hypothetical protein [Cognatiyoonia sp. IB215182]MDX8355631.1 hypothetical protein [Cognatiyoonia sp. IB215182]
MQDLRPELIKSHIDHQEEQQRSFLLCADFHSLWKDWNAARRAAKETGKPFKDPRPARFIEEKDIWRLLNDYPGDPSFRTRVEDSFGRGLLISAGARFVGLCLAPRVSASPCLRRSYLMFRIMIA